FFFSSRRRHTRSKRDWSSDVCSSDLVGFVLGYFTVFIRDIDNLLTHIIRLFFYASPIIWVGGRLPPEYGWLVAINPIAILVDARSEERRVGKECGCRWRQWY